MQHNNQTAHDNHLSYAQRSGEDHSDASVACRPQGKGIGGSAV